MTLFDAMEYALFQVDICGTACKENDAKNEYANEAFAIVSHDNFVNNPFTVIQEVLEGTFGTDFLDREEVEKDINAVMAIYEDCVNA